MKKSRYIFVVLFLLLLVAGYFVIQNRSGGIGWSSEEFRIENTDDIEFISIESDSENVVLTRDGQNWIVNGKYAAGSGKVRGLLVLLSRIKITGSVQSELYEEVGNALDRSGKKIIIAGYKKVLRSFIVYHDTLYSDNTYMTHENDNEIFRVEVPGVKYRNLAVLFNTETAFWRSNVLFQFRPDDIRYIKCVFTGHPEYSFQLINDAGTFPKILSFSDSTEIENINQDKVLRYLSYYSKVMLAGYLNGAEVNMPDEFCDDEPEVQIRLTDSRNKIFGIDSYTAFYYDSSGGVHVNMNEAFVWIDQSEWARIEYVELDPIVKKIDYFTGD